MKWRFFAAGEHRQAFAEWQRLNESLADSHPALDGEFQRLLVQYFGGDDVLIGLCESGGAQVAGAIVERQGRGVWSLFVPGQACIAPLIVAPDADLELVFRSLLNAIPGFCGLLRLPKVDPALQSIEKFEKIRLAEIEVYGTTFAIDLSGEFDDYWAERHKSVRRDARRSLRQLEANDLEYEFTERRSPGQIEDAVRLHGELESAGWKGKEGTAIHIDNKQGAFYVELLAAFADRDGALTFQVYFAGKIAASLLCIKSRNMIIVLKTSYREEFAQMGPGRLIDYLSIQKCFADEQGKRMEMFTRASNNDLRWGTDQRLTYDINIFSSRLHKRAAGLVNYVKGLLPGKDR